MENFVYVLGCDVTRKAVLIDPAWDISGLLKTLDEDDMELVGALVTHYHPDHCGGSMYGFTVEGLPQLMERRAVPVYVNQHEADGLKKVTGLSESDLKRQDGGDRLRLGELELEFLHTPGHTPGSQCFKVGRRLVSGDTLFISGCGRVDLPGGDSDEMFRTLSQRLATLPSDTVLFPGHNYGDVPSADLGTLKKTNQYLQVPDLASWRRIMGG